MVTGITAAGMTATNPATETGPEMSGAPLETRTETGHTGEPKLTAAAYKSV